MAVFVIAVTTVGLVALALLLSSVGAPRWLTGVAVGLLGLEFLFGVVAQYEAECAGGPCVGGMGLNGPSAAAVEYVIPALAAAFTLYAIGYGLRRHRRAG